MLDRRVVRITLLVALVVGTAVAVHQWVRRRTGRLPDQIVLSEVATDLSATFDPATVVEPADATAVVPGGMQPKPASWQGGYRPSLRVPVPSTLRFVAEVPPGGVLHVAAGVELPSDVDENSTGGGTRCAVAVDGREVFARVIDPAATKKDRHWFDEDIDLADRAGQRVTITLTVRAADPARPVVGTPGWSAVRLWRTQRVVRKLAAPHAPSVLLLLVDTLRADRVGCYGAQPSPSPSLDALAARGVLFESMIAQSSWTMPAVASLMTGLHPSEHGVVAMRDESMPTVVSPDAAYLSERLQTLAEHVQAAGISTLGVSANSLISRSTNFAQGFERWEQLGWDDQSQDWAPASAVNGEFLRWLGRNRDRRFFAYLHYMEPHDPYRPPPELWPPAPVGLPDEVRDGQVREVARLVNWHGQAPLGGVAVSHLRALYDAEIRSWDAALGDLLHGLEHLDVLGSTVIIVMADHGEEFQEHGHLVHGIHLYDELLRVPLIVVGPGITPRRVAVQTQTIDLFPTVSALLDAPALPLPGRDLLGAIEDRPVISETRRGLASDGRPSQLLALRTARWKLIWPRTAGEVELYDLTRDPGEQHNVATETPERDALLAQLTGWRPAEPPPASGQDPDLARKLHALGYVP